MSQPNHPLLSAADALEAEYLAVANGTKKPGKMSLEPLAKAVQVMRADAPTLDQIAAREVFEQWLQSIGLDINARESAAVVAKMLDAASGNPAGHLPIIYEVVNIRNEALKRYVADTTDAGGSESVWCARGEGYSWSRKAGAEDMAEKLRKHSIVCSVQPVMECRGPKCGAKDGVSHSAECNAAHEASCKGEGNV